MNRPELECMKLELETTPAAHRETTSGKYWLNKNYGKNRYRVRFRVYFYYLGGVRRLGNDMRWRLLGFMVISVEKVAKWDEILERIPEIKLRKKIK